MIIVQECLDDYCTGILRIFAHCKAQSLWKALFALIQGGLIDHSPTHYSSVFIYKSLGQCCKASAKWKFYPKGIMLSWHA